MFRAGVVVRPSSNITEDREYAKHSMLRHQSETSAQVQDLASNGKGEHADSVVGQDVYTLCSEICKYLTKCLRLRHEFDDARMSKTIAPEDWQSWKELQRMLDDMARMNPILRLLIRPDLRTLCMDLLDWVNDPMQMDSIDSTCKLELRNTMAEQRELLQALLKINQAEPSITMEAASDENVLVLLSYECNHRKFKYSVEDR